MRDPNKAQLRLYALPAAGAGGGAEAEGDAEDDDGVGSVEADE